MRAHVHYLESMESLDKTIVERKLKSGSPRHLRGLYQTYVQYASAYSLGQTNDAAAYAATLRAFNPLAKIEALLELRASEGADDDFKDFNARDVDILTAPIALGRIDLAQRYVLEVLSKARCTPLWNAYVLGLRSLVLKQPFGFELTKLTGMEKHWVLYMRLMEVLSVKGDPSETVVQIDASFAKHNTYRRFMNGSYIDPSGLYPQPWDVRRQYILALGAAAEAVVASTGKSLRTLYKAVSEEELSTLEVLGFREWPPQRSDQDLFCPTASESYARELAGFIGASQHKQMRLVRFHVTEDCLAEFMFQRSDDDDEDAGEWLVPAQRVAALNQGMVGRIEVLAGNTI